MLALAVLILGSAGLIQMFNGGQLIAEKSRLVHATDAAAYSGAVVQARALNFQAYANRTHIAHQVAMAHLVTLASWSDFGATEARQAASANPPAYVIGMMFGPQHGAAFQAAVGAGGASSRVNKQRLHEAFLDHDATVSEILWLAQLAVARTLPDVRHQAMQEVLDANYHASTTPYVANATPQRHAVLDREPLSDTLPGFVSVRRGSSRDALRNLVLEAVANYEFLAPRNHDASNSWAVSWRCPHLRHELRRRGATALEGYDVWRSDDTQSYHALRSNRWVGCYYREYPMGWAENAVGGPPDTTDLEHIENPPDNFSQQDFWRWVREHTSWDIFSGKGNPLANSRAVAGSTSWRGRGMPGYTDVATTVDPHQSVRFAIRTARASRLLPTTDKSSQVHVPNGLLRMETRLVGDELAAVSAAETWFERPTPRADGMNELASLFNPYWQARLSPVTGFERQSARKRQASS